ncbi:uncharacterized protein LOC112190762 [Rosa chinensis]|uniref:uncharacterized protein LOC112190762 n=1 Tax=Rosa chinensis TaxID=74649 RepID=UPI000D08B610|nr:uncharacterized protein LOC112190762 [Rosa chinensis]
MQVNVRLFSAGCNVHLELTDLIRLERFCPRNCRVKVPATLGTLEIKWCSFELKISSDGVLEEIVPNMHLEVQKSHPKEEAFPKKQPSPNASEGAQHAEYNPRELQSIAIKLDEDIGGLRNELRRLQKELSAKEAERRDTEQKLADLVRAK